MTRASTPKPTRPPRVDPDPHYRRILWVALLLNLGMFVVEVLAAWQSGSLSLLADAIDFFGDAANYGVSLAVLTMAPAVRAKTALFKALCMFGFGVFVLVNAALSWRTGAVPTAMTMGVIGFLALCVNVAVATMLYVYRNGDANMKSVWLCSRNDALSNLAVMLAALGVLGTQSHWPDLMVAATMGGLAMGSAASVYRAGRQELRQSLSAPSGQGALRKD
jgi:Co/Zn/Cd efflux system component